MMFSLPPFLRKCLTPLAIALGTMPVGLLLFCFTVPALIPFVWIYPTAYFIFAVLVLAVGGKRRLPVGITAAFLLLLIPLLMPRATIFHALILAAFYSITLLWSLRLGGLPSGQGIPVFWGTFGIAAHLAGQLGLIACRNLNNPALEPAAPWMLVCFFGFAALLLLSMNRSNLTDAADKRQAVSSVMRQKNILLTAGLFLISLAVSFLPAAARAVGTLAAWLATALKTLFFFLFGKAGGYGPDTPMVPPSETGMTGEPGTTNQLAALINMITLAIGAILTLILLVYGLRSLYRKLKVLLTRLYAAMGRFAAAATEDYIDEVTDTREQTPATPFRTRQKKRRPYGPTGTLTPGQRIRHRYQHLSKKHPEWGVSTTARENLPQALATVYEQARYSGHPATDENAALFVSETKHI